ncbi:MAG: AAA family ATPase [Hyphomicrobiaceae bacterium]
MKLRAVRVRELGCFREPIAVEGLSGALDVLAGANEAGKSTLFRAIEALFLESYRTDSQKLKDELQPYTGGAPLIEADFESAGQHWRYRKQLFHGRMAELCALGSGEVVRNADAEERVRAIIGADVGPGLVWVRQREALQPLPPELAGRDLLVASIEQELSMATGGERAQAVRRAAEKALESMVSGQQRRPRGTYKAQLERVADLEARYAEAVELARSAEEHLTALGRLRDEVAVLTDAAMLAGQTEALHALERILAEDERLGRDIDLATERREHRKQIAVQLADTSQRLEHRIAEAARLDRELAGLVDAGKQLTAELGDLERAAESAAIAVHAALAEERQEAEAVAQADRAREHARLKARLAEASTIDATRRRWSQAVGLNGVTPELLARIDAAARAIAVAEARVSVWAPVVEVRLAPGAEGRILSDGAPMTGNRTFRLEQPLVLSLPDVAEIRIGPPADTERDGAAKALTQSRRDLAKCLTEAGAKDVETARNLATERIDAERREREAAIRLDALAPQGLDALRDAVMALGALGPQGVTPTTSGEGDETPQQRLAAIQRRVADLRTRHEAARAVLSEALARQTIERARGEDRQRTLQALLAELPPIADWKVRSSDARRAAEDASREAGDAAETVALLQQRRLPAEELHRLRAERTRLASTRQRATERLHEIERESARLEGLIEREAEAAAESTRDQLHGELQRARRDVAETETEIAGLGLLVKTFDQVSATSAARYLAPVVERLRPGLEAVLGAEGAALAETLGINGLVRRGRTEPIERLSTGTREQIAVLVHLAFAGILAAAGRHVPLILDDALVYADDERLLRMLDLLRDASKDHQVILLTCRTRLMAEAGFPPLKTVPWSP